MATPNHEHKLLILNGPRSTGNNTRTYRGTDRSQPTYCERAHKHDEVNQLFVWFLEEGGECGIVRDLGKATRYADLCAKCFAKPFEVVAVSTSDEISTQTPGNILGYDISTSFNVSLITSSLMVDFSTNDDANMLPRLIQKVYRPQLNDVCLFDNADTAADCLKAMNVVQRLCPGTFEGTYDLSDYLPTCIRLPMMNTGSGG